MTKLRRWLSVTAAAGLVAGMSLVTVAPASAATTIEVCPSGCAYSTINAGVAAASDGDTITVGAGSYVESVTINKALTLVGPNANTSPNTSDPLVASTRAPEAIIKPANGVANHAFIVTGGVNSVSISGFTVDLSNGVEHQRYITMGGDHADLNLTFTNNHFDANGVDVGSMVIEDLLGNAKITVQNNRFTNTGSSNGLWIGNTSANSTTDLTITGNVWLNNGGPMLNNGNYADGTTGTISDNWIGNSTAGTSGVDNFGNRQGGMILAGIYDGLQVTQNTFSNPEDAVVSFWSGFSGILSFTENTIDGYSNVAGYSAIYVRPSDGPDVSDVSGVTFTNNTFDNPTVGSRALLNQSDTGTFEAARNWWGSESGPKSGQIDGPNVEFLPWLAGTSGVGTQTLGVTAREGDVPLLEGAGAPVVHLPHDAFSGEGMVWFEYFPLPTSDLPSAASFPFGDPIVRVDITLKTFGDGVTVDGPFTVCLDGSAPQRLWHYEDGAWVNITNRALEGHTVAPVAGKLCGMVSSFSPFVVAGAALPPTGVSSTLLWTGTLGGAVLILMGAGTLGIRRRKQRSVS